MRWLRREGFLDKRPAEDRSNEVAERSAIDACADIALQGGPVAALDHAAASDADDGQARFEPRRRGPFMAALDGFNLQAAVRVEAGDDEGETQMALWASSTGFAGRGRITLTRAKRSLLWATERC